MRGPHKWRIMGPMSKEPPPPLPFVGGGVDPERLAAAFEEGFPLEFCASDSFDPDFVAALIREGFIPMATEWGEGEELLLPKLHLLRSCLDPAALRVTRSVRRAARGHILAIGGNFEEVLAGCLETHGPGWLRPPLLAAFRELAARPLGAGPRLLSFELRRDGELVAGEFGALLGACYTSYSGFRRENGAGSVQLAATGRALEAAGVRLWDLGMPMAYKTALGAEDLPRSDFLRKFRGLRSRAARDFAFLPEEARPLLDGSAGARGGL